MVDEGSARCDRPFPRKGPETNVIELTDEQAKANEKQRIRDGYAPGGPPRNPSTVYLVYVWTEDGKEVAMDTNGKRVRSRNSFWKLVKVCRTSEECREKICVWYDTISQKKVGFEVLLPTSGSGGRKISKEEKFIKVKVAATKANLDEAMASFLSSKKCTLIKLHLIGNPINDAGCRIIAESLRNNRRLREIRIKESNRSSANITGQAYAAFVRVVCDTSSIESTLTSNHTLADVSCNYISKPPELRAILDMNRGFDKRTVAKLKVLRYHFKGNFNMSAIAGLNTKALPYLLAWFNRLRSRIAYYHQDKRRWCNSVLYRIIRHNPGLCSYPSPEKLIRLKAENQVATLSCELKDARKQIEALKREVEELRSDKRRKIGAK